MTNAQDSSITIDADTTRRIALNEQTNPRQTILGEATQTLNPIDGKPYIDSYDSIRESEPSIWADTNDFLQYQFTLARMNTPNREISNTNLQHSIKMIIKLVRKLNEVNIPLRVINDADSLDATLSRIEDEEEIFQKRFISGYFDPSFPKESYKSKYFNPKTKREYKIISKRFEECSIERNN